MNEAEQNSQKQGRKIIKKYILHQKVNPRLLGVELFNKHLVTPNEAYLSCKLIFKKDVQSLMELEQITQRIHETWTKKNTELVIKRINVYTSTAYIVLTFTIGFYEEAQVKHLRELKECAKEIIETYDNVIKQEKEAEYKRKEAEINSALDQFSQLTKKMDILEDRLAKNESIVLDSGELLKTELTKVSQTIKEQMNQVEHRITTVQGDAKKKKQLMAEIKPDSIKTKQVAKRVVGIKKDKYVLNRSKQLSKTVKIKNGLLMRSPEKKVEKEKSNEKSGLKGTASNLELEVLKYFTKDQKLNGKQMIQKKKFLTLKAKIEFIDYLWMLLELEGKEEIIIANKLSCRELIEDLGQFMETIEKVTAGPAIFNYWVYCSQEIVVKLEGYAALKDFLSNSLKLNNNILVNEL
ncbi:hypothetical protein [Enterococcus caccae]|uniref:Uncharacterized protein n=1 Tax=Enterococcus caccae ATCC BAA-1240 TaxID=1158612 RepID=R3X9Y4_9ENTE|nr:hypothetical protein [Enterococcus caccae]EOL50900.1 hypothetical protein UC7_00013 [Enterococcus caccae ATCC BAA-1240]EOT59545.1 hypothetical protein I580_02577 [Enterococcus caccae ATCC BAA-1240]OJG23587.1 hypothetical protein RU98_GL001842 [Enterococcus caccae]